MKFDGKALAAEIEHKVAKSVGARHFKLVSILVGNDPASELYTKLKMAAAERVGIAFDVVRLPENAPQSDIVAVIEDKERDSLVTGIMIQLPLPTRLRNEQKDIISHIPIEKDVDGLRWQESGVMPATVRAVLTTLEKIGVVVDRSITIVGSEGSVGKPLIHFLSQVGYMNVAGVDLGTPNGEEIIKNADVVISCVGKAGLISVADVKSGLIAIDVGISQSAGRVCGDMTQEVYNTAAVSVEVPGGIGPVTIACLMANAVDMI